MTPLTPDMIESYRAAFDPGWPAKVIMALSVVPTLILLAVALWIMWPQQKR